MTALATIADRDMAEARITIPRVGRWTVDLVALGDAALPSRATLRSGDLSLVGTVIRQGNRRGAVHARLAGGGGGLARIAPVRHWQDVPLRLPLGDLLAAGGEVAAGSISSAISNLRLPRWTTQAQPLGVAVGGLAAYADATWRTLGDGTIWIGAETWPTVAPELDVLEESPEDGRIDFGAAAPVASLWPGTTWRGVRVQRIEWTIGEAQVRGAAWYLATTQDDLQVVARAAFAGPPAWGCGVDYLARYDATIEAQSADGRRVDVRPDAPHVPPMANVPLRLGLPGCTAKVSAGARVTVSWMDGDPSLPIADAWPGGETVTSMEIVPGGSAAAREGDAVHAGTVTGTVMVGGVPVPVQFIYAPHGGIAGAAAPTLILSGGAITSGSSKVTIG